MTTETTILGSMDLFKDIELNELEEISFYINHMKVTEGEVIAKKGHYASNFYIILNGNFMVSFDDTKAITVHKKGEIVVWSTAGPQFKYLSTAVALTNGEVLSITSEDFFRLIQSNSALGDKLMKRINNIVIERMLAIK